MKRYTRAKRTKMTPYHQNNSNAHNHIVHQFMELLITVKLYHWKTRSFPEHKSTDELYAKLNEHIDKFVEVMLGKKSGTRVEQPLFHINAYNYSSIVDLERYIEKMKKELIQLDRNFQDTDLLNIRDEILGDLNQFTYLLSFH